MLAAPLPVREGKSCLPSRMGRGAGGEGLDMYDEVPRVIGRMISDNLCWDRNAGATAGILNLRYCRPSICLNRFSALIPPHPPAPLPQIPSKLHLHGIRGEGSQRVGKSESYICVETNARRESLICDFGSSVFRRQDRYSTPAQL